MSSDDPVTEVLALFAAWGDHHLGEIVTQEQHGLQSAQHAVTLGASDEVVAAALLHDIGHLLVVPEHARRAPGASTTRDPEHPSGHDDDHDDDHAALGADWLEPRFGASVAGPVGLHVSAKRYLCTVDPGYRARLSGASTQSLRLQGDLLDPVERVRFEEEEHFAAALVLRGCDDRAKDPDATTVSIDTYIPLLRRVADHAGS